MDFYICALSFGQNAIGQRQRIGATVSVYLNGTFIWCAGLLSKKLPVRFALLAADFFF